MFSILLETEVLYVFNAWQSIIPYECVIEVYLNKFICYLFLSCHQQSTYFTLQHIYFLGHRTQKVVTARSLSVGFSRHKSRWDIVIDGIDGAKDLWRADVLVSWCDSDSSVLATATRTRGADFRLRWCGQWERCMLPLKILKFATVIIVYRAVNTLTV